MNSGVGARNNALLPRILRINSRISRLIVAVLCLIPLSGCWDEVNLQDVGYISALGIDFIDGEYVIYAQMINFTEIAKTNTPAKPQAVWIGRGKGSSVLLAYSDLSRASYATLNLEHLKTIVIQKRALGKIGDVLDGLNRHRASRYTAVFFGTAAPIEELFNTDNFFDQSPLNSILYLPSAQERHNSFVKAMRMQTLVQSLKEPGMTTLLPTIGSTTSFWKQGKKTMNTQILKDLFVFKNVHYQGQLHYDDVIGLRWLNPDFKKAIIEASEDGGRATISITETQYQLRASLVEEECHFLMKVKISGHIIEMEDALEKDRIIALIEQRITDEIMSAYKLGVEKELDLMNLEHHLYRYHNRYWKNRMKNNNWKPEGKELKVETKFNLTNSGKLDSNTNT